MQPPSGHIIRVSESHPCKVCGGHEHLPRGRGVRCFGFLSPDGLYAHCSRSELSGALSMDGAQTYGHYLMGPCRCGFNHRDGILSFTASPHAAREPQGHHPDATPLWRDPDWRLVATYPYCQADGRISYRVQRWERLDGSAKTFKQQRHDPASRYGWKAGLQGVERLPYRLPELVAADPRRYVLLAEGEKSVEALRALGLLASCNSEGAHKGAWRPELSPWFAGRHVVILPDADGVGWVHGQEVATALAGVAASIQWLELPGLPPKGDIVDWLAAGGTVAELCRLVRGAPRWSEGMTQHEPGMSPSPSLIGQRLGYSAAREIILGERGAWWLTS